jgi:hypothetical protein
VITTVTIAGNSSGSPDSASSIEALIQEGAEGRLPRGAQQPCALERALRRRACFFSSSRFFRDCSSFF